MKEKLTQAQKVLKYINDFGSITSLQAFMDLGIIQLPKRIFELRHSGIDIRSDWIKVTNRYGEQTEVKRYFIGGQYGNTEEL